MIDLQAYIAERDDAFRRLDLDWARKVLPMATSDEVRLLAMHMARYECTSLEDEYRIASGRWLKAHGHTRLGGADWLAAGALPTGARC